MRVRGSLTAVGIALGITALPAADASAARLRLTSVGRFDQPVYVTAPRGDARVYVVERAGRVLTVDRGNTLSRPFLNLRSLVGIRSRNVSNDQGGLLSIAFAPDYAATGRVYALYTSRHDTIRIDEFRRSAGSPPQALLRSRRTVLSLPRTSTFDLGGQLQFGPDRLLYIGLGYTTRPSLSQDLGSYRGKILRIQPERPDPGHFYEIPRDNPFVGRAGARPEIYAYGLRVPWRFSFDRKRGDLVIGDVGDHDQEEIDYVPRGAGRGANFGYPIFEGGRRVGAGPTTGLTAPVFTRRHAGRFRPCAIIGGYVVRDPALTSLAGRYVYGDLCAPGIRSLRLRRPEAIDDRGAGVSVPGLVSFGEDGRGRLYTVSIDGQVSRLTQGSR